MNNLAVKELYSEKHTPIPSVNFLLKISLGLILFTMISTALVYAETMSVDVDGTSFDLEYDATGMTVSGIEADTDFISLILTVDVTESSGTLDITLDRSFFDSTFEGLDDDFIILADGDEPISSETATTTQSRTLSLELPAGTEEIEIIGSVFGDSTTVVVPDTSEEDAAKAAADAAAAKAAADAAAAKAAADAAAAKAAADAAADNTLPTQCGSGTVLKDGACVLDERCGPGTVLKDGACVLDTTSQPSSSGKELGSEFAMGVIIAIAIAGTILVILAMIAIFGNQFNKWAK
jgi:hypothetical protein